MSKIKMLKKKKSRCFQVCKKNQNTSPIYWETTGGYTTAKQAEQESSPDHHAIESWSNR